MHVNNKHIANFSVLEEKSFLVKIPQALVTSNNLLIDFLISNPTSPDDVLNSKDQRKLGISVRDLILYEDK
jgi:hypothetical protein